MNFKRSAGLILASGVMLGFAGSAFALNGNDVATKLSALMTSHDYTFLVQNTTVNGDQVILKDVTFGIKTLGNSKIPIGDVTLDGVNEYNGGYKIAKATFGDISVDEKGFHVSVSNLQVEGITAPATIDPKNIDVVYWAHSIHAGPGIGLVKNGNTEFSFSQTSFVYTIASDRQTVDYAGKISDFKIAPISGKSELLRDFGFNEMVGSISANSRWTASDGKWVMAETADISNVGRFDLNIDLSGFTLPFLLSYRDAIKAARTAPDYDPRKFSVLKVMGASLRQLTLNGFSIRFADAGITNSILDFSAKQRGMTHAQFTDRIKGVLSKILPPLGETDLRQRLILILWSYLDKPESLEISLKPAKPMLISEIVATAKQNPADLEKTINLKVLANH